MRSTKLSKAEKAVESDLSSGVYRPVAKVEFQEIAAALQRRRKDAVLNVRMNREDLEAIKKKAKRMGIPYQTLISEFLHRLAA